jgi:hypothetical protein
MLTTLPNLSSVFMDISLIRFTSKMDFDKRTTDLASLNYSIIYKTKRVAYLR